MMLFKRLVIGKPYAPDGLMDRWKGSAVSVVACLLLVWLVSPAEARSFPLEPQQNLVGGLSTKVASADDTLLDIARAFDVGFTQLVAANPKVNAWVPRAGQSVAIPSLYILPDGARTGIVVNLVQQRLFYFPPGGGSVETYPIGVGVEGRTTPIGTTSIVRKRPHPTWYPPPDILAAEPALPKVFPPGPHNPMGDYALNLGWPTYAIHGTNKPDGIGRNVSHGCLRLFPEDIERLYHEVSVGTPVRVINEPVLAAWADNDLYVVVFPSKAQASALAVGQPLTPEIPKTLIARVAEKAGQQASRVDWTKVEKLGLERNGIPTIVTKPAPSMATSSP